MAGAGVVELVDRKDMQNMGPDGVLTVETLGHLANCSAVIYTMRVLFTGGLWPEDWDDAALLRADAVEASSAHDRLRPLFGSRAPIAAPVLLPNFVRSTAYWGGGCLWGMSAGGSVWGTGTDAARVETLARSRQVDPADLSWPLPGIRTKDRTSSPVSTGPTMMKSSVGELLHYTDIITENNPLLLHTTFLSLVFFFLYT